MKSLARIGALLLLLGNLVGNRATATSAATAPVNWQQAWPMVGHDPQRTARSAGVGPLHPHLIWTHTGLYGPPLFGPDESVYSWQKNGLIALTATGRQRWMMPAQESFGGPAVLGSDGLLRVSGQLPAPSGRPQSAENPHVAIFAITQQGQQGWSIRALPWATVPQSVPFSKGEAPLITASGRLYVPFVGPVYGTGQNNGVEVISPAGAPLRRLLPGWSGAIAIGSAGALYAVGGDSQGHTAVLASHADGTIWWRDPVPYGQWGSVLIGQHGMVYATVGSGYGPSDSGEVRAYTPDGRLVWRFTATAGVAVLAQGADGTLLVADARGLSALGAGGARRWYRPLGQTRPSSWLSPSLVVDSLGRAYAGSSDGMVRAIAPDGTSVWSLSAGGPRQDSIVPMLALGPGGLLAVMGTDGVLRVYR